MTENTKQVEIGSGSQLRCGHWEKFAQKIKETVVGQSIISLPTVLHFCPPSVPLADASLHLIFSQSRLEIPGAVEEKEGALAIQYLPGQLFLQVYNLPDCPDSNETNTCVVLLNRLLPQVVEADPEKIAALLTKQRAAELVRSRELWLGQCQKRFEKTLTGTKAEIVGCERKIPELQKQLVEQIRILDGLRKKLDQLEATRPESEARYVREFDKLLKTPHVERVTIDSGKICVFTDTLFVRTDDGKVYEMGRYRIEIYTDGGNGGVRFFNLTRQVKGYWNGKCHHPHVKESGEPCLGNIKEAVPQLLGEYQYSVVTILAIRFLESVNTNDSAGAHIINWPLVSETAP